MQLPDKPQMSVAEQSVFRKYLQSAKHQFEFGSGGSTVTAAQMSNLESVESVDSDPAFLNSIRESQPSVKTILADIGPTGDWGQPKDDAQKPFWSRYCKTWDRRSVDPDLVLVDGRFRVACALKVLLSNFDPIIMIHDFWSRDQQHVILQFVEVIEKVDSLCVCKKLPQLNYPLVEALLTMQDITPD